MDELFPTFRRMARGKVGLPFAWPWYTTAARRRGLLRVIATAIEEKLPFVPLLEAWAQDERGVQRNRVRRLIRLLNEGVTIADAVEQVPGILRDEDALALRFDAQTGTVTTAVRESLAQQASVTSDQPARWRSTMFYLCALLLLGVPIVVFIEIKIIPAFRQIFSEFNLGLPRITEAFIAFVSLFEDYWWLWMLLILVGLSSLIFAAPGRFARREMARLFSSIRARHVAGVLRMIAITSNAGRPIAGALSTLARYHYDPAIRNKLLYVRNELEQGADLWPTMGAAGLLADPDVRALNLSERVGNRSWVLTQLAYGKNRRARRKLDRLSQLVLPAVVLLMGAFVLFQSVAIFMSMTSLIKSLA
jgi:type II secretory pathway component PulF